MRNERSKKARMHLLMNLRRWLQREPKDLKRYKVQTIFLCNLWFLLTLFSQFQFEEKQEEETKELKQSCKNKTISHHCQPQQQPPSPTKSKNILPASKNISPPSKSPHRRPAVPAPVINTTSSNELESEFSRVFNQLRGDKHELVV